MAISTCYPLPVSVNGFSCRNCSDVAEAKRHIDPTRPTDGPFGGNAKHQDEARRKTESGADSRDTAFRFGGVLSGLEVSRGSSAPQSRSLRHALDVRV